MNKFIVTILFIVFALTGFAQRPEMFPSDSTGFFKEVDGYFKSTKKPEARKFLRKFEDVWFGGYYTDEERAKIYEVCNKMNDKKMLPFPEFHNYLKSVMNYKLSEKPYFIFQNWHVVIDKLLAGPKRRYNQYLKFSVDLLESNALYKTNTITWQSSNSDFIFGNEEEPVVYFPSIDLYCLSKGDTSVIYETSGKYYPMKGKWVGQAGKVDWKRAGFDPDKVYALLNDYEIDTKHPYFNASSVLFHNPQYFGDDFLPGKLEEKVLANVTEENALYPRFYSLSKTLVIKNLVRNVDYEGGFAQLGGKFLGKGLGDEKAKLIFYREGEPFLTAKASSFAIRKDRITTERAKVTLALDEDSIFHPGVKFQFLIKERLLSLIRTGDDITKSPYYDTYHNIDMRFEAMYWKIDDPLITMESLVNSTNRTGLFESLDYFEEERYDDLYRIDNVHPLVRVMRVVRAFGMDQFYIKEAAKEMRLSLTGAKLLILELASFGYLAYDSEKEFVQVKPKLFTFIQAKAKKIDYDVLSFNSQPQQGKNAKLNLSNNELTISGIERVLLSDSHMVYIYPKTQELIMKKNRDFSFDGIINAGNFEIFGNQHEFSYDNFKFDSPNIDSIRIYVNTKVIDEFGRKKTTRLKTVIVDVKGELLIDSPGNKSGLKSLHKFPKFNSLKESYAYYDKKAVQGGVYNRDNFSFQLEPFELDSLDNFKNQGLNFEGTFESAGIFPVFNETLSIQPDYSLGFVRPTPPEGFDVYNGKGKFYNEIKLSNEGLKGDGYLEYLTSTTESKDLNFHPDSMFGIGENYVIEEQMDNVQYPPVSGNDVFVKWLPIKDYMKVYTKEKPLSFYDGESKFYGSIKYNPKELRGAGKYEFQEATLYSRDYLFKFMEFDSDTADFILESLEDNLLTFNTTNVNAHVDFKERKALFISNAGSTIINLPENQYIAKIDRFTWFMDSKEIELSGGEVSEEASKKDLSLEGSKFTSVHPDQDSLSFYSSAATFDYNNKIIKARNVKLFLVGDSYFYPDSGKLIVRIKANMDPLKNAVIVANTVTEYHRIYDVSVKVKGRLEYKGEGNIDYIDQDNQKQVIFLENVSLDTTYQTVGRGKIKKEQSFALSPDFQYYGNIRLEAAKPLFNFDGFSKISHTCKELKIEWFEFNSEIDPKEIYIPIDSVMTEDDRSNLLTGIMMSSDPYGTYSNFLTEPTKSSDYQLFNSEGFLFYDKPAQSYIVSSIEKITQKTLPGNYLVLNKNSCAIEGEGMIRPNVNFGRIDNEFAGSIVNYTDGDSTTMDMIWLMDFYFDKKALSIMEDLIIKDEGLGRTDFDRNVYKRSVQEILGKEEADRIMSEQSLYQKYKKFPKGLAKPIFFNDLKMQWNNESESYRSVGKIGIGNMDKTEVNKFVDGNIEFIKKRSGDELHIYLEIDRSTWFYFNYRAEIFQAYSSNQDFNTAVKDAKKTKLEKEKGKAKYRYMLSSEAKKAIFLRRIQDNE
mgnify:CR=1 FL=1|tara:strand:- start:8060 stop:12493 length:4434 start_codon:yes stop_codon:yes gene_type:complete